MQITASLEVVCISILKSFIFCVDGMLTGMLMYYILDYISHNHAFITCAGHGRKKLHASVRNDSHKAEMYKYLWMLMTEGDPTVFQKNLLCKNIWVSSNHILVISVACLLCA